MRLLAGHPTVEEPETFLEELRATVGDGDLVVQAFDARYVAGRRHIERAVSLARRERDRGEAIADSLAVEVLCYAAGRRQIDDALTMGVGPSTDGVVVAVFEQRAPVDLGEAPSAALDRASSRCQERFHLADPAEDSAAQAVLASIDEARLTSFFDVSSNERTVALAGIPELVAERVALLVVER